MTRRNPDTAPIPGGTPDQIVDATRRLSAPQAGATGAQSGRDVIEALVFLGLADRDGTAVTLTPKGHALARSTTAKQQRRVFSTAAATVPLIRDITSDLRRHGTRGCLPIDRLHALAAFDNVDDRQIQLAIAWGGFAGLLRQRSGRLCLPTPRRWTLRRAKPVRPSAT